MKEYIRIVDVDDESNFHEDKTDSKDMLKEQKDAIKDTLKVKLNKNPHKFQKHICDHDESNRRGCKLEDI